MVAALVPTSALADVVVYEQHPNGNTALISDVSGGQRTADDFVLSSTEAITSLDFWGMYFGGPDPVDGLITVSIYSDESGPGDRLLNTTVSNLTRQIVGTLNNRDEYMYSATMDEPFSAQAGSTYWISITKTTTTSTGRSWGWETSDGLGNGSAVIRLTNEWQVGATSDMAFRLYAIPSPGGMAVTGIALSVFARRRRP